MGFEGERHEFLEGILDLQQQQQEKGEESVRGMDMESS